MAALRIGIFDSGVGGLSILRAVHGRMPDAALHYIADSAHAPYGERDDAHIVERSMWLAQRLLEDGADALVVACNTATAIAIGVLRDRHTALPIIGVEPGLKPALALTRTGRVGVMATAATLRSTKFRSLLAREAGTAQVHLQACDGLAAAIEAGDIASPRVLALVQQHCGPLRAFGADTVVLGCTHYSFVRDAIQAALGGVQVVDTAQAVARRVGEMCAALVPRGSPPPGRIRLESTGDVRMLERFVHHWLPELPAKLAHRADDGSC